MKERPILFSAPMVLAVDRQVDPKTQTRRVVKWPRLSDSDGGKRRIFSDRDVDVADMNRLLSARQRHPCARGFCPYGQPGDRLWVRECFADEAGGTRPYLGDHLHYRADPLQPLCERWTPSIHMPRWASRITLEVTGVRVERLNEISEADARAEGCEAAFVGNRFAGYGTAFAQLWESINGAGSWDANPWVWVVEFRRL